MLGYNLVFLTSLIWIFSSKKNLSFSIKLFLNSLLIILLSIFIGLRHEVGGDWNNYKLSYSYLSNQNLLEFLNAKENINEVGFKFLIFLSSKISLDYYLHITNFICAIIFVTSFIYFINKFPYKSILFFFSIPYLIIVVSMGYTRQSVAIGFLFLSLLYLNKNQNYKSFLLILLGSLFHKTLIFALLILIIKNIKLIKLKTYIFPIIILFVIIFFYFSMLQQLVINFLSEDKIETFGARLRLFINFMFSILYLLIRNNWDNNFFDRKIIDICAMLMFAFFITSFIWEGPIVSAFDRLSIYLYPVNIIIISNFFCRISSNNTKIFFCLLLIILSYLFFIIWANYGDYSHFWFPYKNIIIK